MKCKIYYNSHQHHQNDRNWNSRHQHCMTNESQYPMHMHMKGHYITEKLWINREVCLFEYEYIKWINNHIRVSLNMIKLIIQSPTCVSGNHGTMSLTYRLYSIIEFSYSLAIWDSNNINLNTKCNIWALQLVDEASLLNVRFLKHFPLPSRLQKKFKIK